MNQPLASEISAIGTRQVPVTGGDGEGSAGAGENADWDGDGLGAGGDAIGVGLAVAMDLASWGTAPHAAIATQQTAANTATFARISLISNGGVGTWYRAYFRLWRSASPHPLAISSYPSALTEATWALNAARL